MHLLRKDINILPGKEGSQVFLVRDPRTGEIYEFGPFEHFFLTHIRNPYVEEELLGRFSSQFNQQASSKDFHDFLDSLHEMGWLEETSETGIVETDVKPQPSIPISILENKTKQIIPPVTKPEFSAGSQQREAGNAETGASANKGTYVAGGNKFWFLFCPEKILDSFILWFYPLRWIGKLLPFVFLVASFGFLFNLQWVKHDAGLISDLFKLFGHLVFTLFTINLGSLLVKGIIARHFQLKTPSFGIILAYGLIPRFFLLIELPQDISKNVKLWLSAGAIFSRLFLFSLGSIVWLITRSSATLLPELCFALAYFTLLSLLFVANPLINGDGYQLLATYLEMPNLRQKANRAFLNYFKKTPEVIIRHTDDRFALKLYAVASFVFIAALLGFLGYTLSTWLKLNYRGLGVFTFLALIAYIIFEIRRQRNLKEAHLKGYREKQKFSDIDSKQPTDNIAGIKKPTTSDKKHGLSIRGYLWLGAAIVVMLLPYPEEVGGDAEVEAISRREIYAEYPGIVEQVFFEGGEWIEKNSILAQMVHYKQVKDVEATAALLLKQQKDIAVLKTTPLQEEVDYAVEQLDTARVEEKYSIDSADRIEKVFKKGYASKDEYEDALLKKEVDAQKVLEKLANLAMIKNKVNPYEIESATAEEKKLQEDLIYYREQLERTKLRTPIDGQIITMKLKNTQNKYLDEGVLFAEVEDTRKVRLTVSISEADIGEVELGDKVRLKIQAYPENIFEGTVSEIYPAAESTEYGAIVKVVSIIDNGEKLLKSGMTGYAKVAGLNMTVIQAFTRAMVRFFRIEMWSWIP